MLRNAEENKTSETVYKSCSQSWQRLQIQGNNRSYSPHRQKGLKKHELWLDTPHEWVPNQILLYLIFWVHNVRSHSKRSKTLNERLIRLANISIHQLANMLLAIATHFNQALMLGCASVIQCSLFANSPFKKSVEDEEEEVALLLDNSTHAEISAPQNKKCTDALKCTDWSMGLGTRIFCPDLTYIDTHGTGRQTG